MSTIRRSRWKAQNYMINSTLLAIFKLCFKLTSENEKNVRTTQHLPSFLETTLTFPEESILILPQNLETM